MFLFSGLSFATGSRGSILVLLLFGRSVVNCFKERGIVFSLLHDVIIAYFDAQHVTPQMKLRIFQNLRSQIDNEVEYIEVGPKKNFSQDVLVNKLN